MDCDPRRHSYAEAESPEWDPSPAYADPDVFCSVNETHNHEGNPLTKQADAEGGAGGDITLLQIENKTFSHGSAEGFAANSPLHSLSLRLKRKTNASNRAITQLRKLF